MIETFELLPASETAWADECDPDAIVLCLVRRDADGEDEGGTRLATFSNMRFMDSLSPQFAKLCQETAQAELDKVPKCKPQRASTVGPEPHARLGDDVVVCDFDWNNPLLAWPGTWLFHDVKRDRALFQVRKSDVGHDPSVELLVALLLVFSAGERVGKDVGRADGRNALAGEMRKLIGVAA